MGSCDPYIAAEFGNASIATKPQSGTRDPIYYERMLLPYTEPSVSNILKLKVVDYDSTNTDDLIGTIYINKNKFEDFE